MSQDSAIRILNDPKFALNLKRWCNEKKIKHATKAIDFSKPDSAKKQLHSIITQKPQLFEHDKSKGKSAWDICHDYYNKLASYVFKR